MAAKTWTNGNSTGIFNDGANWDGAGVPGSGDDVTFDDTSVDNCRLDVAIDVQSITIAATYSGDVDGATDDLTHDVGTGGVTHDGTGDFKLGDGTWTVNGKYDTFGSTNTPGTGLLKLTGTASGYGALRTGTRLYDVEISGSYNDYRLYCGTLTLKNGSSLVLSYLCSVYKPSPYGGTVLTIEAGATVGGGTGQLYVKNGDWSVGDDIDFATISFYNVDYTGNCTLTLTANVVFKGDVEFAVYSSKKTLTFAPSNYNFAFEGDLSHSGILYLTWTNGTGTMTFQGSENQSIDLFDKTVEDIVVNKTGGTITFTDGWVADSFDAQDGDIDFNQQTLETTGLFRIRDGVTFPAGDDLFNDVSIEAGGGFDFDGGLGTELVFKWSAACALTTTGGSNADFNYCHFETTDTNDLTLNVAGTATAHNSEFEYVDAGSGSEVDATDSCVDNGNNHNFDFGGAPAVHRKKQIIGGGMIG